MYKMLKIASMAFTLSIALGTGPVMAKDPLQCTAYVKQNDARYVGFNADAKNWYSSALSWGFRHRGMADQPEKGDVIVVDGVGAGSRQYGHVMLIRSIESFKDIRNFEAYIGHANYPKPGDIFDNQLVVVKNGKWNETPVLGVITPRDVGFSVAEGTYDARTLANQRLAKLEVTLRYVGKTPGNTKRLAIKHAAEANTAYTNFEPVSFYKFFEKVNGDWLPYDGELKSNVDYKLQFFTKPKYVTINKKGSYYSISPQWCLNDVKTEKLGCFQFRSVTIVK